MSVIFKQKEYKIKALKNGKYTLNLTKKKITDISLIENLNNIIDLEELILDNNQISKIQGLDKLVNLTKLSLKNNNIRIVEGLDNLSNLEDLDLEGNNISEINGLDKLVQLRDLNLWKNQISELKGLENNQNLKTLRLYGNPLYNWIRTELSPVGNIAPAAIAYCRTMKGDIKFNSDEVNNFLATKFDEVTELIQKEDYFDFFNVLKDVYNEVFHLDNCFFYDFLGNILRNHTDLFSMKFLKEYNFQISKILLDKYLLKMEKYIICIFCSFEKEYLVTCFLGEIRYKSVIIKGRIYVTNYRIITLGEIKTEDDSGEWPYSAGLLIFEEIIDGLSLVKNRKTLEHLFLSKNVPVFGYNFPILNTHNYSYSQESISFGFRLPQNKKMKNFAITIIPKNHFYGIDDFPITKLDALLNIYNVVINRKENDK